MCLKDIKLILGLNVLVLLRFIFTFFGTITSALLFRISLLSGSLVFASFHSSLLYFSFSFFRSFCFISAFFFLSGRPQKSSVNYMKCAPGWVLFTSNNHTQQLSIAMGKVCWKWFKPLRMSSLAAISRTSWTWSVRLSSWSGLLDWVCFKVTHKVVYNLFPPWLMIATFDQGRKIIDNYILSPGHPSIGVPSFRLHSSHSIPYDSHLHTLSNVSCRHTVRLILTNIPSLCHYAVCIILVFKCVKLC